MNGYSSNQRWSHFHVVPMHYTVDFLWDSLFLHLSLKRKSFTYPSVKIHYHGRTVKTLKHTIRTGWKPTTITSAFAFSHYSQQ